MQTNRHYELIARAIRWVAEHQPEQPDLALLASELNVSPHHLQRTFQAWAGVSPKQFLKSLTRDAAMHRLVAGSSVLETSISVGLSGPGRLHDLLITTEALTPGEVRSRGKGVNLSFGFGDTPFGQALVSWTARGLNFLGFCEELGAGRVLGELREVWAQADLVERPLEARDWLRRVFAGSQDQPLQLWLRGSPFQLKVWEALMTIPDGASVTYAGLARKIGQPTAARAVGSAVGANPLAWIIPCHRVIRQQGEPGGYRWGAITKRAVIGYESTRRLTTDLRMRQGQILVNA
ncbi:MAG: methylated-DNA--[protein]-cysteine S-methyltransferase [Lysobacterales bacterium]|nr:MAG: methylated-DNA--[protein]-cysteine S-methyltransferase [Xanthomonadales bacterium]